MSDSDKKPGFTVTDRRTFSGDGEVRQAPVGPETTAAEKKDADAPVEAKADRRSEGSSAAQARRDLPPADFSTFLLSLGSSALIHLGEVDAPGEGGRKRDLPMAKHTIDLLDLLREKTRNNLSKEEDELLESLLYDLRLRYVEAVKRGS